MSGRLILPSGRELRGRGRREPGTAVFTVFLLGSAPPPVAAESRWVRWPDFWLPTDRANAHAVLVEAWQRAASEPVEFVCGGGRGRTGTAMACLAVLDGVPPTDAVGFVRQHYHPRAVETPWQRRYVERFIG